jgi:hypothetical protein
MSARKERGKKAIGLFVGLTLLSAGLLEALAQLPRPTGLVDRSPGELLRFAALVVPKGEGLVALYDVNGSTGTPPRFVGRFDADGDLAQLLAVPTVRPDLSGYVLAEKTAEGATLVELVDLHARILSYAAFILLAMAAVILYDGIKNLWELDGERMILESTARFRHVVEYGTIAIATGVTFTADELCRRMRIDLPWKFAFGTAVFVTLPVVVLSYSFLIPKISARIGIGTKAKTEPG